MVGPFDPGDDRDPQFLPSVPPAAVANLYLATVIDCCSRRIAGWAITDHMRTELVEDALKAADSLRGGLTGAVFHSDHGSQGGFNPSSQHRVVNLSVVGLQALPPVFSTPVSCGGGC